MFSWSWTKGGGSATGTNTGDETPTRIGALIGASADATPNDTDYVATALTGGGILKKITWANVKAFLKSFFDTKYSLLSIFVNGASFNPQDGLTYYFGNSLRQPTTGVGTNKLYIRQACALTMAELYWYSATTAGSNENVSIYIRVNNTTDYLVATVRTTGAEKIFSNTGLSISLAANDYIEIKIVCPTWATNPVGTTVNGYLTLKSV